MLSPPLQVDVACARRLVPVVAEFGGANPLFVTADADLTEAAAGVLEAVSLLNGQWCAGPRTLHKRSVAVLNGKFHQRNSMS